MVKFSPVLRHFPPLTLSPIFSSSQQNSQTSFQLLSFSFPSSRDLYLALQAFRACLFIGFVYLCVPKLPPLSTPISLLCFPSQIKEKVLFSLIKEKRGTDRVGAAKQGWGGLKKELINSISCYLLKSLKWATKWACARFRERQCQ